MRSGTRSATNFVFDPTARPVISASRHGSPRLIAPINFFRLVHSKSANHRNHLYSTFRMPVFMSVMMTFFFLTGTGAATGSVFAGASGSMGLGSSRL